MTGMAEGLNPFCFLMVPPRLLEKHPFIHQALRANQERLTTHFDIYQTLRDITINFQGQIHDNNIIKYHAKDVAGRGISLFQEIPLNRTCYEAGIDLVWCQCNENTQLDNRSNESRVVAKEFIDMINDKTEQYRSLCSRLEMKSVLYAFRVKPDSVETTVEGEQLYKIAVTTKPGGAVYEGLIRYSSRSREYAIYGSVDRLNMFQKQAMCMKEADVKPFCFCKDLI